MSPISATKPMALIKSMPRSACSAWTTVSKRQPAIDCPNATVKRATRSSALLTACQYSVNAVCEPLPAKLNVASQR